MYWWAGGVYSNVHMDDRLCLLVIIGVTEHGGKELVAVEDGYRESEASWSELLLGLRECGLTTSPKLAIGDGVLGFWKALYKCYPDTRHQRCWMHKTSNIMSVLPKFVQPKVEAALHDIWMAETRDEAHKAFDRARELHLVGIVSTNYTGLHRKCLALKRPRQPTGSKVATASSRQQPYVRLNSTA